MVLLLNYLHWLVIILAVILTYLNAAKSPAEKVNRRFVAILVVTLVTLVVVQLFPSSYGYKGTVERVPVPVYEVTEDGGPVIQDRLRKSDRTNEERKEDFDEMVDWREAKKEREEEQ